MNIKLRGKVLLVLLVVAVVPLLISLVFLSNFTKDQIRSNMVRFAEKSSNFVERSTIGSQQELSNYLRLLSSSSDMVNALYYASLTQDVEQLYELVEAVHKQYDIDILEVLSADGSLLLRAKDEGLILPEEPETDHPLIVSTRQTEEAHAGLSNYLGKLTILAVTPVRLQENVVGYLVGSNLLDDKFADRVKEMAGVEVAFLGNQGVVGASHPDFRELSLSQQNNEILLGGRPYLQIMRDLTGTSFKLVIAQDLNKALEAQQSLQNLMVILIIIVIANVFIAALIFSRTLTRPLLVVVNNLREISQGEADLTRTLKVSSSDEVGELASNFNRFVDRLREMVLRISSTSDGIVTATEKIRYTSREVNSGTAKQTEALEDAFQSIQGIDESTIEVSDSISSLLEAVELSSSATLELGATIEEIVSQVDRLFSTIESVSSSITEMSASSQQVTDNLDNLSSSTEVTASSITEMDASIKEVEGTAQRTNELSEQASLDAEKGQTAVAETIAGIQAIRTNVEEASRAIEELGKQSGEIGTILTVIDDVADQTRLLSLNASIIAAQAGEHGKGICCCCG